MSGTDLEAYFLKSLKGKFKIDSIKKKIGFLIHLSQMCMFEFILLWKERRYEHMQEAKMVVGT